MNTSERLANQLRKEAYALLNRPSDRRRKKWNRSYAKQLISAAFFCKEEYNPSCDETEEGLSKYNLAKQELLEGIPGLLDMSINEGFNAIDTFNETWKCPAISFNPWRWFSIAKHDKRHFSP